MSKLKKASYVFMTVIAVGVFYFPQIHEFFWEAPNAIITLSNCNNYCTVKGTLKTGYEEGSYTLITDSKKLTLSKHEYKMIVYSDPNNAEMKVTIYGTL